MNEVSVSRGLSDYFDCVSVQGEPENDTSNDMDVDGDGILDFSNSVDGTAEQNLALNEGGSSSTPNNRVSSRLADRAIVGDSESRQVGVDHPQIGDPEKQATSRRGDKSSSLNTYRRGESLFHTSQDIQVILHKIDIQNIEVLWTCFPQLVRTSPDCERMNPGRPPTNRSQH